MAARHFYSHDTVDKAPPSLNMPLIYGDSLRDDEDICNILAAFQLGSASIDSTAQRHSRAATAANNGNSQGPGTVLPAARPHPTVHDQPSALVTELEGKHLPIFRSLSCLTCIAIVPALPAPGPQGDSYDVSSGRRTGIRDTWYV